MTRTEPPSDARGALLSLLLQHVQLVANAGNEGDLREAFKPLLIARSIFNLDGQRPLVRAPSKAHRALRAEAHHGWRSHESSTGTMGRPRGTSKTPARKLLDDVIEQVTDGMPTEQRERVFDWLFAKGTSIEPGSGARVVVPPGRQALLSAVEAELRAMGNSEPEIRRKRHAFVKAIDNRQRNLRAQSNRRKK